MQDMANVHLTENTLGKYSLKFSKCFLKSFKYISYIQLRVVHMQIWKQIVLKMAITLT